MSSTARCSMVDAIHQKYDNDGEEISMFIHVPASAPGKKESGHIAVPPILALHDSDICDAGDGDQLESLCGNVQELDLTKNVITEWEEVFKIIERMPRLWFLNLTSNILANPSSLHYDTQFPNITNLVLNNTGITWNTLNQLLGIFPSVKELHVSLNNYTSVDLPEDFRYTPLTKLYINNNNIKDWSVLSKLGRCFPCLENFISMESDLTSLSGDDVDLEQTFPCLKALNLSGTKLSGWEDIEVFRLFPLLEDLRIKDIPFLEEFPEKQRRQKVVARLPNITKLNGSPIYDHEREEAERMFIREFMDSEDKPARFHELQKIHGKLDHLAEVDMTPDSHYHIKVKFGDKEEMMDIAKDQSVLDLKKSLKNFCNLSVAEMMLCEYIDTEGSYIVEMNYCDNRRLHSYKWTEINELHIFKKPNTTKLYKECNFDHGST